MTCEGFDAEARREWGKCDRNEIWATIQKGVRADVRIELKRLREKGGPDAETLGSPFRG